jgi:hypothetical protein
MILPGSGALAGKGVRVMSDTVRIERPMCCRRRADLGGRVKLDSSGNAIQIRTRVQDSREDFPARGSNVPCAAQGMERLAVSLMD